MNNGKFSPWLLATLITCASLTGCGGGGGGDPLIIPDRVTDDVDDVDGDLRVYVESSPYAAVLEECVEADREAESCRLSRLPLLGMETENPTVADVMDRVVVSHDWMGARLEQTLNNLPDDVLQLLRATTAVVISADIRPAYYTTLTGAIYLDPAFLWLTQSELDTISTQEDPRSGYDDPLQFRTLSRYVDENSNYIYPYGLLAENPDKTETDVAILLGELLFHELAHANDFLPPDTWDLLNEDDRIFDAIEANEENFVSTRLKENSPLLSEALYDLADVMYWGDSPTTDDIGLNAAEVGAEFEADLASDHYAYASIYEDTAMLFEEAMMKLHFNIDRDVAFTDVPTNPAYCDGYIVRWGVRNRVGETDVKSRAQFVTGELLPTQDTAMFFQNFPAPEYMTNGLNWCDSINLAPMYRTLTNQVERKLPPRDIRHRH